MSRVVTRWNITSGREAHALTQARDGAWVTFEDHERDVAARISGASMDIWRRAKVVLDGWTDNGDEIGAMQSAVFGIGIDDD